jgi:CRP-like cAMP-binding protein
VARGIPAEVIRHFQAVPLFASVSKKGLRTIVEAATEVDVPAGKVLVREGDYDQFLYVILRGTAEVRRAGRKLRELAPGEFFGEIAFLHKAPRSATVIARSDMRVMVLGPRELAFILERQPAIAHRLLDAMAKRVAANERTSTL